MKSEKYLVIKLCENYHSRGILIQIKTKLSFRDKATYIFSDQQFQIRERKTRHILKTINSIKLLNSFS